MRKTNERMKDERETKEREYLCEYVEQQDLHTHDFSSSIPQVAALSSPDPGGPKEGRIPQWVAPLGSGWAWNVLRSAGWQAQALECACSYQGERSCL